MIVPAIIPVAAFAQVAAGEIAGDGADPAAPPAQESVTESARDGSEIIVTASKRAERLQDVPAAITAVTGERIDNLGIRDFRDYATLVPGLSQRDTGAPGQGTIILRGLNSGPQQVSNTTAVYIDETPFTASGFISSGALLTPSPELAEVERIEVLKGPQGTLYGASNLGGLVRIITKKPDLTEFHGLASGEVSWVGHGEMGFLTRGTVNVPLIVDKLAVNATGYYRRLGGFTDNVRTGSEDVNRSNLYGGRLALRYAPTSDLTIDLSGIYQDIDNFGTSAQSLVPGSFTPRFGEYAYSNFADFGSEIKYRIVNSNIEYRFDIGTLSASGSYANYKSRLEADSTAVYLPVARTVLRPISQALFGVPIDTLLPPDANASSLTSPNMEKWTGEVRFASDRMGPVEFIVGAFYTNEDNIYYTDVYALDSAGAPLAAPFDVLIRATTTSKYEEIAGFGNLTLFLTDELDVTGGLRYAHNKQVAGTGGPGGLTYFLPREPREFDFSDDSLSYLATLRWRPTADFSAYLRAASGYRPGGPQTNPTPPPDAQTFIRPDTVWNYEAGVKGSALDGALSFDASVYHIDWNDIQLNSLVNGIVLQGNAASATVDGFELQLTARPSNLLSVSASVGHTDAKVKEIDASAASATGARAGDKLPLTPDWTTSVIVDHRLPLSDRVIGNLGATLRFQSDAPSTYPALNPTRQQKLPEITTLDLRASATVDEWLTVQFRLDNVTDQLAFTNVGNDGGVLIRPRTVTLGLSTRF